MSDRFYPSLTEEAQWAFIILAQALRQDPHFMLYEECPYGASLKDTFSSWANQMAEAQAEAEGLEPRVDTDSLEAETARLFRDLKTFGATMAVDDVSERMAYFRTATSLLEKIISLQERTMGLKQISEFQTTILSVLEDVLTADQRTSVMSRLKEINHGS